MYEKDCSTEGKKQWENWEVTQDYDGMWATEGKPTLPKRYLICVVIRFHNKVGGEAEATASQIKKKKKWAAPGIYATARRITNSFPVYQKFSSIRPSSETGWLTMNLLPFSVTTGRICGHLQLHVSICQWYQAGQKPFQQKGLAQEEHKRPWLKKLNLDTEFYRVYLIRQGCSYYS